MGWWVKDLYEASPVLLVSWVFWVVGSIVLHELGHGWAAMRAGDMTPRALGHMTWNPGVHIPPLSWLMFAICGCCWGLMPVDPSRFRRRHDDAVVALAGPAMNVGIALVMAVVSALWVRHGARVAPAHVYGNVGMFVSVPVGLNLFLAMFNMLPIPPLDGSRVAGSFFPAMERWIRSEQGVVVAMMGVMLLMGRFSGRMFDLAQDMGAWLVGVASRVV